MADEAPQQVPEPAEEGERPEASKPKSRGIRVDQLTPYFPLIIAIIIMPLLAWVTVKFTSSGGGSEIGNADHKNEETTSHGIESTGAHDESGSAPKPLTGKLTVPVPITRNPLMFQPREPGESNGADEETASHGSTGGRGGPDLISYDRIVVLNHMGESLALATADKITVHVAGTDGKRLAVARLLLEGKDTNLVEAVNRNRQKLFDAATEALSNKTLDDMNRPGFKDILRAELHERFIQSIAPYPRSLIERVLITELMIQ